MVSRTPRPAGPIVVVQRAGNAAFRSSETGGGPVTGPRRAARPSNHPPGARASLRASMASGVSPGADGVDLSLS
jgi:hypothetical protein